MVVTEGCLESRRDPGHDEELSNGPEVKIDILDEGYWSPEVFRGYRVITSMTEMGFRRARQVLGAPWARGQTIPLRGCAPSPFPK